MHRLWYNWAIGAFKSINIWIIKANKLIMDPNKTTNLMSL